MRWNDNAVLVRSTADGRAFRDGSRKLVSGHPVLHSVVATTLDHAIDRPADHPRARWYWATRGQGRWLAVGMHTPPRPFHLVTTDAVVARAFAARLLEQKAPITEVGGMVKGALAFAESWVDLGGAAAITVARRQGLHDLPGAARRPKGVAGAARPARPEEAELLDGWAAAYAFESHEPEPGPNATLTAFVKGGLRVWDVDGEPVAMAYASRPHAGVTRLSWVFTPPEHRGHGYASALVAAAASEQKQAGHRVLLYTDLASQPATRLYERVGFRHIGNAAVLRLLDEEPVLRLGTNPLRRPATVPPAATAEKRARRAALTQMVRKARLSGRN